MKKVYGTPKIKIIRLGAAEDIIVTSDIGEWDFNSMPGDRNMPLFDEDCQ